MASSRNVLRISAPFLKSALFSQQIKAQSLVCARWGGSGTPLPWNYIWAPSMKVPVTKEERAKAAAKYGMIEEDYQPYPDGIYEEKFVGDYPDVKPLGHDEKPGHVEYDWDWWKRDVGQPVHLNYHWYIATRSDTGRMKYSVWQGLLGFLAFYFGFMALCVFGPPYQWPLSAEQRPSEGTHYTFERADE